MIRRTPTSFTLLGALFLAAGASIAAVSFGGWAVTTIHQMPDYAIAGKPLNLEFTIRQHGVELMPGLKPEIEARAGTEALRVVALPGKKRGAYASTLTLPTAGEWSISIFPGWGKGVTLVPLQAIAPGANPVSYTAAERGRRLFVAKGCVTCHGEIAVGPDLASRQFPEDYVKELLADPARTFGSRRGAKEMPNLNLDQQEIAALAAYVGADKTVSLK
jgi:cytochrome c553